MHPVFKKVMRVVKFVRVVPRRKLRNRFKTHKYLTLKQAHARIKRFEDLSRNSREGHVKEMDFFVRHYGRRYITEFIIRFGLNTPLNMIDSRLLEIENLPGPKRRQELFRLRRLAEDAFVDLEKIEKQVNRMAFTTHALMHQQDEAAEVRHFIFNILGTLASNVDLVRERINDLL